MFPEDAFGNGSKKGFSEHCSNYPQPFVLSLSKDERLGDALTLTLSQGEREPRGHSLNPDSRRHCR